MAQKVSKLKKTGFDRKSFLFKILVPMFALSIIQLSFFFGVIFISRAFQEMRGNLQSNAMGAVNNRADYLQTNMRTHWGNIGSNAIAINSEVRTALEIFDPDSFNEDTLSPINPQPTAGRNTLSDIGDGAMDFDALSEYILKCVSGSIIDALTVRSVYGAFVVLDGDSESNTKYGLHYRRTSIGYEIFIGSLRAQKTYGASIFAAQSKDRYYFSNISNANFYDIVRDTAQSELKEGRITSANAYNYRYWSTAYASPADGNEVITCSMPLIIDKVFYGVFGVDILARDLSGMDTNGLISEANKAVFVLATTRDFEDGDKRTLNLMSTMGAGFYGLSKSVGVTDDIRVFDEGFGGSSYSMVVELEESATRGKMIGIVRQLSIYDNNSPFRDTQWVLAGMVEDSDLYAFTYKLSNILIWTYILAFLISAGIVIAFSFIMTKPIKALSRQVSESDPFNPIKFTRINITEFDSLLTEIENLNAKVMDSANKLEQIINVAAIPVGAFEQSGDSQRIFYTGNLFKLLDIPFDGGGSGYMLAEEFFTTIHRADQFIYSQNESDTERVYKLPAGDGKERWVRLNFVAGESRVLGVVADITKETNEMRTVEYERDHDVMTQMMNRRAFHEKMEKLFENHNELGTAAMMMIDLDNLKYVNDTYGHDLGDKYIVSAAKALRSFDSDKVVPARLSGDEFIVFIYGYSSKEEVKSILDRIRAELSKTQLMLPDNTVTKVRASAGVSWYGQDSNDYHELMKYADFAMYKVKKLLKGEMEEFNLASYNREAFLLHGKEELNKLIEEQLVEYHFQPIVSVRTGKVFGYEALIRSQLPTLKSPDEILKMAASQSKLYKIEELTWFKALEAYAANSEAIGGAKLFINSIASQVLPDDAFKEIERLYKPFLDSIVVEFTEEEHVNEDFMVIKRNTAAKWGAEVALDDYGSGNSNERTLLQVNPDFVKIDIALVRNIDKDGNKQTLVSNIIRYCKGRKISIIAEGIETYAEMKTLVEMGVDYLQGYYLARPAALPPSIPASVECEILALSGKTQLDS